MSAKVVLDTSDQKDSNEAGTVSSPSERWRDVVAVGSLVLFIPLYLRSIPGGLPPFGGDILVHVYPLFRLLSRGVLHGRPTLWNPYAAGGYPLAPYSTLPLFLPVALALTLSITSGLAFLAAAYLAILGGGMYALARDLGQSRAASFLSALTLTCSGFIAAHLYAGHLLEIGAVCPLPLAFLFFRRALDGSRWWAAVISGILLASAILAAGAQFLPFAFAPLPLLAVWHTAIRARARASFRRILQPLGVLLVFVAVGGMLGAAYSVPFASLVGTTLRSSGIDYATATAQSLPWSGLLMLAAPHVFGTAPANTYWLATRRGPYFHEIYAYIGLLPLLLAPVSLRLWPRTRPYGVLAFLSLIIMLGRNTPLYHALLYVPGADYLRAPARAGLTFTFAASLLTGWGLDAFGKRASGSAARARDLYPGCVLLGGALVATLAVASRAGVAGEPLTARHLALLAAGRLGLGLFVLGASLIVVRAPLRSWVVVLTAAIDLMTANGPLLRPFNPASYYRVPPAILAHMTRGSRVLSLDGAVPLGAGMVSGTILDTQDAAPLALADYWRLTHPSLVRRGRGAVVTGRDTITDLDPFFLRLFGVTVVTSGHVIAERNMRLVGRRTLVRWRVPGGTHWNASLYQATSFIYRETAPFPSFFVARRAERVLSAEEALRTTRAVRDPRALVIISPSPAEASGPIGWIQRAWGAWLAADSDNTVAVTAEGGVHGGYLVADDGWAPDWLATVDGHEVHVERADYLLRAVPILPGRHLVRMVYAPMPVLAGVVVTLSSAILILLAAIMHLWRRGRQARSPSRAG